MAPLREISRTATFAWSPVASSPFLATGTRAGAIDADFSNVTQLELWDLDLTNEGQRHEPKLVARIETDSRFYDIDWVQKKDGSGQGVIAGALDNGSLDLWDAQQLVDGKSEESHLSRTSKHSGPLKALQFNPFRSELLATAGAKGEVLAPSRSSLSSLTRNQLYISDMNNVNNPFRLGSSVGRADDFECLDWNKIVPHILVTGSNTGSVTVWDVKTKKESLTLNNMGRKAVGAIAWDPVKSTRLITAIPHDSDPLILVWDLRNSNAPERVLRGHDGGVLSLSWCAQDNDLLLSCGKDNRSICWNPQTGESYGEFPIVTNWTFQTRWNPRNPTLLATASFDGKIRVQSIQSTISADVNSHSQTLDDKDFFNRAQADSLGNNFILPKAPKWMERPCGTAFGFGGKILSFSLAPKTDILRHSTIRISLFAVDVEVNAYTEAFEIALNSENLRNICKTKAENATAISEKSDWEIIETLTLDNPRNEFMSRLGFSGTGDATREIIDTAKPEESTLNNRKDSEETKNRLSAFFDNVPGGGNFLSDLKASQSAKTNNPFHIYSGSETKAQQEITRALLLGQFERALDLSLSEGKLLDAFMIATCGGETCIAKVQKAYFNQTSEGPNHLRLLASIVSKNLWDVVYNADISCWKEVMTVLCTYAGAEEFSDLCEALGDRLEGQLEITDSLETMRKDASFCYLAGLKLEKVTTMWISEMEQFNSSTQSNHPIRSNYSLYARSLQSFIEKVTVFREVIHFQDSEQLASSGWKLYRLYDKYIEYADMVASHGNLHIAERYLAQVPEQYPAAAVARNRVKEALRRPSTNQVSNPGSQATKIPPSIISLNSQRGQQRKGEPTLLASNNSFSSGQAHNAVAQLNDGYNQPQSLESTAFHRRPYQPLIQIQHHGGGATQPTESDSLNQNQQFIPSSLKRIGTPSPSIPSQAQSQTTNNWNDTPESFFRPPTSRRATPGINPVNSANSQINPNIIHRPSSGSQQKPVSPLAPPPKGLGGPPPRLNSPSIQVPQSVQLPERPVSAVTGVYAPSQSIPGIEPINQQLPALRGPSPYHNSPSPLPPSNRYAPAPIPSSASSRNQSTGSAMSGPNRPGHLPRNPYAPQLNLNQQQPNDPGRYNATPIIPSTASQTLRQLEPHSDSLKTPPHSPKPSPSQPQQPIFSASRPPKYAPGDRSHIPSSSRPIYEVLNSDMQRVKARAPSSFKAQVIDTEKRLNILFDHLNNGDLLNEDTLQDMVQLSQALQSRDFELAQNIHVELMTNKTDECGNWMVGVKRLIGMSKATP